MDEIASLINIDYPGLFVALLSVLIGFKAMISLLEWIINKLGLETRWMRKQREERELLIQTAESLSLLQQQHIEDTKASDEQDKHIQNELSQFMKEIRVSISETQNAIRQLAKNQVRDREQSLKIQMELTNAEKALMCGSKELLGAEIDKRYREYIALNGIPESEVSEFDDIFNAYKGLMGNHTRDTKYNYVKNHLTIIPVETKLVKRATGPSGC